MKFLFLGKQMLVVLILPLIPVSRIVVSSSITVNIQKQITIEACSLGSYFSEIAVTCTTHVHCTYCSPWTFYFFSLQLKVTRIKIQVALACTHGSARFGCHISEERKPEKFCEGERLYLQHYL